MNRIVVLALAAGLAGCGHSSHGPAGGLTASAASLAADYHAIADRACACTDRPCLMKVYEDRNTLDARRMDSGSELTDEQDHAIAGDDVRYHSCTQTLDAKVCADAPCLE